MKPRKTFERTSGHKIEANMANQALLDDIATGEATLESGAAAITHVLDHLDDENVDELFSALRSWVWKTLESRRRDDELVDWIDLFGRVAAYLENQWGALATKLEAYVELLQASVMVAGAAATSDPLKRKHVRTILSLVYRSGGKLRRQQLLEGVGLKDANLSNIIAPLRDRGWIQREMDGREAIYRLTERGREVTLSIVAHHPIPPAHEERLVISRRIKTWRVKTSEWGELRDENDRLEPPSYLAIVDYDAMVGALPARTERVGFLHDKEDTPALDYIDSVLVKTETRPMSLTS